MVSQRMVVWCKDGEVVHLQLGIEPVSSGRCRTPRDCRSLNQSPTPASPVLCCTVEPGEMQVHSSAPGRFQGGSGVLLLKRSIFEYSLLCQSWDSCNWWEGSQSVGRSMLVHSSAGELAHSCIASQLQWAISRTRNTQISPKRTVSIGRGQQLTFLKSGAPQISSIRSQLKEVRAMIASCCHRG
jgi:hypothetical protein